MRHVVGMIGILIVAVASVGTAHAGTVSAPEGAHPRLFLEASTQAALRDLARDRSSYVGKTVERCHEITMNGARYSRDLYMGLDWAQYLQACLVAYRATGESSHGRTALKYFKAILDDLKEVGDGLGGDASARRDRGFAIRALGPNAALAYDWLHDFPGVDEALRARARQRFDAWTQWYIQNGYRPRSPGTNYNAGYVFAATLIAIAQYGEAGKAGERLWSHVVDELIGKDLLPAMTGDGVLVGGDWGEGWQYAPLSIAEYALSLRAVAPYGVDVGRAQPWLSDVLTRHVFAMVPGPGAQTHAVGDTQAEGPYLDVRAETLAAVLVGPADQKTKRHAESEMRRLRLYDEPQGFPLFRALASAERVEPMELERGGLEPVYVASGVGTLYARFNWTSDGAWFAASCSRARDIDHMHPNAGNFVLRRGPDDVIVDPSPYGTLSTLTGNAPTVESKNLPDEYLPSQAFWGLRSGYRWISRAGREGLAIRCDYADQYRIQQTPTDVPLALRDFVLIPESEGTELALVIIDRARSSSASHGLHLRFRTTTELAARGGAHDGRTGKSRLRIQEVAGSSGSRQVRNVPKGSCFDKSYTRGNCDAARFPVVEYRSRLNGPEPWAVHAILAMKGEPPKVTPLSSHENPGAIIELASRNVIVAAGMIAPAGLAEPARESLIALLDAKPSSSLQATKSTAGCTLGMAAPSSVAVRERGTMWARLGADCSLRAVP